MRRMRFERVRRIEECAANGWPAPVAEDLDGWRLRWNAGVSSRANSVWPNAWGGRLALDERLMAVEVFYRERGQPPQYQMCPAARPDVLDDVLEHLGYEMHSLTHVQIAALESVRERVALPAGCTVERRTDPDDAWFALYARAFGMSPTIVDRHRPVLAGIQHPAVYVTLHADGEPIAVGRGVVQDGNLGVFGMGTLPEARRRGAATGLLHSLVAWGAERHATQVYLQVEERNTAARTVYARAGFQPLYDYYFRRKPLIPA